MKAKQTRRGYVLWPLMLMSTVSIAGACGSDDSGGGGGDGASAGESGSPGNGTSGSSNNVGGADGVAGMSSTAGSPAGGAAAGGAEAGGASGAGGGGGEGGMADLCVGLDLNCADDDNPCTEDECNPATGECGIPRSETDCDDGLFCNGADTCAEGECTEHAGNACGALSCNEGGDYCECAVEEDCPADVPGDWGTCMFDDVNTICDESGMQIRPVTTFTCSLGKCEQGAASESQACTRETDALPCATDGNRCNGAEACVAGVCKSANVDPCAGNVDTPHCYNSDPTCRECTGSGLVNVVGCAGGEYCCSGTCKTTSCKLVISSPITSASFISVIPIDPIPINP